MNITEGWLVVVLKTHQLASQALAFKTTSMAVGLDKRLGCFKEKQALEILDLVKVIFKLAF